MSLISSFLIDPVVRQARRFSGAAAQAEESNIDGRRLSHANPSAPSSSTAAARDTGAALDEGVPQTAEGGPSALSERFRPHAPFIRRSSSAVVLESSQGGDDGTLHETPMSLSRGRPTAPSAPTAPIDIPADVGMSSNPSRTLENQLRRLHLDSPLSATPPTASVQSLSSASAVTAGQNAPAMSLSESLPADDGMRHLRARIHQIRGLDVADEQKARMMHSLMTERYNFLRPTSPSSFVSHDRPFTPTSGQSIFSEVQASSPISNATEVDPENPYNLRPGDLSPQYRPRPTNNSSDNIGEDEELDLDDEGPVLGCEHYKRNVKVQCYDCRRWYMCRHCHDAIEDHNLNRKKTQNMLCMVCRTPQKAAEYCAQCETQTACYYCDVCKLWDNNSKKKIYHCNDCGICRRGEGLGKDYIHCKNCNVCISIGHATTHKCLQRATDCDCPICGEYLFTSSSAVVSMPCGHYLHKDCYNLYMETAYKCPICKKSAVNMELQWQKLTQAIESQPMPEQFADTRAVIQCNDCSAKSSVKYHWLGNKCNTCDSYNTNEMRILDGPESEEVANAILDADADARPTSPASVSSPSSQPLRSPRYYFQPDQPEETWLPGQLPSFQFQMPQFPNMPQMPQMPQFPSMPQLPPLPQMPQMPDPYEMLERVRQSFDHYLNPTGEVRPEDVPIIDLGDDPRERRATDGTTVREPSLPQYVLERFSRSLTPLRNYWTPSVDNIPRLDLSESQDPDALQFWGEDGGRVDRFLSGGEEDDEEEEESSSDESMEEDEEDDDDEGDAEEKDNVIDLPGHR